ncbi:MAG: amidohydrolase [Alphaproteobacteria bacterium]|nr:MAG: amidohydrolase [Alphaproteobacteria bacterium]
MMRHFLRLSMLAALAMGTALVPPAVLAAGSKAQDGYALPLEPTRNIAFETDEGTWMSLDVSPDGKTIIFDLLGDLYSLDIKGGVAKPLLTGFAFEHLPRFSPDGKSIAFISDRTGNENVWVMDTDGANLRQLAHDTEDAEFTSPSWSADGSYVYASRNALSLGIAVFETWMYHTGGGQGVRLTAAMPNGPVPFDQRQTSLGPVASPDGKYLYFASKMGGFDYNMTFPQWQVSRLDLASGQELKLVSAPGSAIRPELSPDGKMLAYGSREGGHTVLRLRDLESGADRVLTTVSRDDQEGNASRDLLPGYSFTPDGKAIIIGFGGHIQRIALKDGAVATIPFTAKVDLAIGPELHRNMPEATGDVVARVIQAPAISPKGDRLAFSAFGRIHVKAFPDGAAMAISPEGVAASQPTWTPDGKSIVYVTWDEQALGAVWRVAADGKSAPKRLNRNAAYYSDPAVSPDGKTLVLLKSSAYEREQALNEVFTYRPTDIVRMALDGGAEQAVLTAPGAHQPHFAGDSNHIYFSQNGALKSVSLTGADERQYLAVTGPGDYFGGSNVAVDAIRLSPDHKRALVRYNGQLYLIAVPPAGARVSLNLKSPVLPVRQLSDAGADYFGWGDNGTVAYWSLGHQLFSVPAPDDTAVFSTPLAPIVSDIRVSQKRDVPDGWVLLSDATIYTMQDGSAFSHADILIQGNRIAAIGAHGSLDVPAGTPVRDLAGKYVIPGFVDTHAHWFEIRRDVIGRGSWVFKINLAYGVTSGLDVQAFDQNMFVYKDMVDAGEIVGPRLYSVGRGFFSNNRLKELDEARTLMRRNRDYYGTRNVKSYVVGNRKQRQLMVMASAELGMLPTTEGAIDSKLDITHAIDGFAGNEHALTNMPLYRDVVELFARTRISYTPTLLLAYGGPWAKSHFFISDLKGDESRVNRFMPRVRREDMVRREPWAHDEEEIYPELAAQAAKIFRAGGRIGIGSHGEFQGLGFHWEMQALASGGLKPIEVLQAATRMGSEIIGRADDIGTLEAGKLADMLILDADPAADIRNTRSISIVMKNGRLYDAETLEELKPGQ